MIFTESVYDLVMVKFELFERNTHTNKQQLSQIQMSRAGPVGVSGVIVHQQLTGSALRASLHKLGAARLATDYHTPIVFVVAARHQHAA